MARTAFLDLPAARKRALLDVAGRRFAAHGLRGASYNAILTEAGVPKGVAYYYFEDKLDLYATVLEDAWSELAPLFPRAEDALEPALRTLYRAHLAALRARPWLADLARQTMPEELAPRFAPIAAVLAALWERMRTEGVRQDLDPDLLVAMVAGLDGAIDRWWATHPDADEAQADAAFDVLLSILRSR